MDMVTICRHQILACRDMHVETENLGGQQMSRLYRDQDRTDLELSQLSTLSFKNKNNFRQLNSEES